VDVKQPRISLNVDRLVVDGVPHVDQATLREAIHQELSRLIAENGVPAHLGQGFPMPNHAVTARPGVGARAIGAQVAQAIYGGIGGQAT
jgi:hypothetical protein